LLLQRAEVKPLFRRIERETEPLHAIGRFISADPLGIAGGLNLHGYCENDPVNEVDPEGMDWLNDSANFSAGWGDTLSFSLTRWFRRAIGADDVVNSESGFYAGGELVGMVHTTAFGIAGGTRAAGAKAAGKEFSHWIPDRYLRLVRARLTKRGQAGLGRWLQRKFGRSRVNGNFVSSERHFRHDSFRYPPGWRDFEGPSFNPILQQIDRVPRVIYGTVGGASWGALGRYLRHCPRRGNQP
jgi:hypothetical protein